MLNVAQLARTDLNLLIIFDLLFTERNAAKVAAKLNLSPSAISHSLRRLRVTLNDPLFFASAKGMMPTERAHALAPAIRDIVERLAGVIASAEKFDPGEAERRFRIGAPDGAISVLVPALVRYLEDRAPKIDISVLQLLPSPANLNPDQAWRESLHALDAGRIDLAILPHRPPQDRFHAVRLYAEQFVFIARAGHAFAGDPSVRALADCRHVLVSATGDTSGFVDALLAEHGLTRRIALTAPSFLMVAAAIASSDLIGAVPRRFALDMVQTYDLQIVEPPFPLTSTDLHAIVLQAAMMDQGITWLVEAVTEVSASRG